MSSVSSLAVTFTAPMPGLEGADGFTLRSVDGAPGLFALEASAGTAVRLFLADASVYVPGYSPPIPEQASDAGQTTTLLVVNPGTGKPTVNLAAPLVLNPETGTCTQLLLEGDAYSLRAELGGA
ncbi:flagellar assembly protein FliW [Pseudarthrobacter sp. NBSH8]|uniref:flagellar assembly protein FliW n=1 Tax=Pseudarthrobacter sp. NBSH8 TaxID=2596911 RepID=UPI0016249C99|nr:flagellar assembly protein FliW [Pseudarthrobacter sp. NBSH8]QNE15640.1 flagellar assembly protein FliW [Pseudarthrobacter sp. NBSH8]